MNRLKQAMLLVGLLSAAASAAPQQRDELPVLSARTDLVILPVTVVDAHGALVTGLRPGHFTVYDSGVPQTIELFTSDDRPATIGLLIDSSGSMRGYREQVMAASAVFDEVRGPGDEFFTLRFNELVWPALPPSVVMAQGMTALYDALDHGLTRLERGVHERKALILLSDGGDNASVRTTLEAVLERARRTDVVIYSVTVFAPGNRDARPRLLKTLTSNTGGHAFTVRTPDDVRRAFGRVAEEIRSGYTIGFVPADLPAVGFRTIRVVVSADNHPRLIARTRAGYYAGPSTSGS